MEKLKLTKKQGLAYKYLTDTETIEILYGGAAGGGKSFFGALWIIANCFKYPGSRWLMGRAKLDALKKTTLNSFFDVASILNVDSEFNYNANEKTITFKNGSQVILKDLFHYPSDPNFDSLGSLEITGGFIDECNQVVEKAKNVVMSRIRYKLTKFDIHGELTANMKVIGWKMDNGEITRTPSKHLPPALWLNSKGEETEGLIPKLFMTCNPAKGWVYESFFKPHREDRLPSHRKFIQALLTDNKHLHKSYAESLSKLDEASKQRLLYGNWDYSDDAAKLFQYEDILDMFTNEFVPEGEKYITADIARFGKDKTIIALWNGWRLEQMFALEHSAIDQTAKKIREIASNNYIPMSKVIADEDGVGGGVVDILKCKGFVNNSTPLKVDGVKENFSNLKSQCYFKLADKVRDNEVYIKDQALRKELSEELDMIRQKDFDKDGKKAVEGKENIKILLGRSPDVADTIMMRCYFDLVSTKSWVDDLY